MLNRVATAEGLRDGSGKPGEGFVYSFCAGFGTDSPDEAER